MNTLTELVSAWQVTLSKEQQQIILRPWVTKPGDDEQPAQSFALTLPIARMLQRELAEAIQLLEAQSADSDAPIERRKTQQRVPNDRRKARRFEGSPSPQASAEPSPDQPEPPKTAK